MHTDKKLFQNRKYSFKCTQKLMLFKFYLNLKTQLNNNPQNYLNNNAE